MEVYLDNSATTRCFDEVAQLMMRIMCEDYGNPSSMHHKVTNGVLQILQADFSMSVHRQIGHPESLVFQIPMYENLDADMERLYRLREMFLQGISKIEHVKVNGCEGKEESIPDFFFRCKNRKAESYRRFQQFSFDSDCLERRRRHRLVGGAGAPY